MNVFGPNKLPELGQDVGQTWRQFQKITEGLLESDGETEEVATSSQDQTLLKKPLYLLWKNNEVYVYENEKKLKRS